MTTSSILGTSRVYSLENEWRCACGGSHLPEDHQEFLAGMPQDRAEMTADLIEMGHYQPETLALAETVTHADMRAALLMQLLDRVEPEQRQLCNELLEMAGGLDAALSAAFGPNAREFLTDTIQASKFRRREFLTRVAAAAAVVTAASCVSNRPQATAPNGEGGGNLEKTEINIGFIPIACSIPIVLAEPQGFYEKYGLKVTLKKMPNWATVRESAIAGELDAYHMLSPMPIAMTLGLGSTAFPVRLASIENINGQSIAVANKHLGKVKGPADFKGMSIGVPFPYSMHNLLLRYYLASGNIDPDKDVKLEIVPPPDSVAKMAAGQLDAFLMPDNFGQRAVAEKIGFIHLLTKDLWQGHPCCSFAASQKWIDANPNTFRAVNKAIIDSALYANDPANRLNVAKAMSPRKYLNQPEPVLAAVLTGKFDNGQGQSLNVPDRIGFDPYPWKSFAKWITSQMVRWDLMEEKQADYAKIADDIYMTDLARELAVELKQSPPDVETRLETLKFDKFDPAKADIYVQDQIKKFGV